MLFRMFNMVELTSLITGVGFPIAVAVYLLVFMRGTLDKLTNAIDKNSNILSKICEKLNIEDNNG